MVYLRKKGKYWSLVGGTRDPETGKVKQKVLKYYGVDKPENFQLAKDIAGLGLVTIKDEPEIKPAKAPKAPRSPRLGTTKDEPVIYTTAANLRKYKELYVGKELLTGNVERVLEHDGKEYIVIGVCGQGLTPIYLNLYRVVPKSKFKGEVRKYELCERGEVVRLRGQYEYVIDSGLITMKVAEKQAFDIEARISNNNIKTVLGTTWRNKHTQDLLTVSNITENTNRPGEFDLWGLHDTIDECEWVHRGQKWKTGLEHWYRVDNLTGAAQTEAFCKRIGYCREEEARSRKEYNRMRTLPAKEQKKDSCFASNLNAKKQEHYWDEQDLEIALKQLEKFKKGGKYEDMYDLQQTEKGMQVQKDQLRAKAPVCQGAGHKADNGGDRSEGDDIEDNE